MNKTKDGLIKEINYIADLKIKQGIDLKTLALSINQRKEEKTLKEWVKMCINIIELKGGLKDGIKNKI